jgi:Zn finger protein HypA/HybF involved in hydrogenase expression
MPNDTHEWEIDCPDCGIFTQVQKGDPTICPKCHNPNINTKPIH